MDLSPLDTRGWIRAEADPQVLAWARAARAEGVRVTADPAMRATWLQCQGTWFVGVDALPTLPDGSIGGVPLAGPVIRALSPLPALHPAQLSVTYPGYPRPRKAESEAAFRYRLVRDAAHVDGLIAEAPERKRYLREPHAWILGLPLTETDPEASPLTVYEGSGPRIRAALRAVLERHPPEDWPQVDLTQAYQQARRDCFERCPRVTLHARPGEALLLHRHCLHGVAPWAEGAKAPPEGRMIAYFRPMLAGGAVAWIET
ncbi:hypothetical protein [Maliponia aquimaris]|uniref:Phytanoyl-CoA dioxygenase (PhyH) n=1 Tax=Maliponia aquimaris TaxID=1673631 RepID=A0A238K1N3_9RHOB|nr:hypothetical protein [Maliponia aquimaris]SMX36809.1 hypothetical protein MAA8898_01055 [Maliponia aquimaris]